MTIQSYLDSIQDKKVAVFGIGVSNIPLIKLLRSHGIAVTACDKNTREGLGDTARRWALCSTWGPTIWRIWTRT